MKKVFIFCLCLSAFILTSYERGNTNPDNLSVNNDGLIVVGFSQVGAESDWRLANPNL